MTAADFPFRNRRHAGRVLAQQLDAYAGRHDLVVLALPRGGVAVGFEVAHALQAPLDVFIVRKLGMPGQEEYAIGAIASGGVRVLNPRSSVPAKVLAEVTAREQAELARREQQYRGERPLPPLQDRCVIVVDDGLATGSTMRAAVLAIRQHKPSKIVVAVPVGAPMVCELLRKDADDVVCAASPVPFRAVGLAYEDFPQASDLEVRTLLEAARLERALETH